eukprot:m51a1_g9666 putative protease inhibitor (123) ;mRNA; r:1233114-1233566
MQHLLLVATLVAVVVSASSPCPPGVHVWNCLVDPCSVSSCPRDPTATCHSNYCGGCNAVWTTPIGLPAVCNCPAGVPQVECLVAPCSVSHCDVPGAVCTDDYCGGCNAIWRTPLGVRILSCH